ncbi:MAG: hypothetical protein AAB691_03535 [Patescibacteria group bacterium]
MLRTNKVILVSVFLVMILVLYFVSRLTKDLNSMPVQLPGYIQDNKVAADIWQSVSNGETVRVIVGTVEGRVSDVTDSLTKNEFELFSTSSHGWFGGRILKESALAKLLQSTSVTGISLDIPMPPL